MKNRWKWLCVPLLILLVLATLSEAGASGAVPNAAGRPVWILMHRCNANERREISQLQRALDGGCNGVEMDIRWSDLQNSFVLCHDDTILAAFSDTLEQFFARPELKDPRMCLVILDVKEPRYLAELCRETHRQMDGNGFGEKELYIVYSVAELTEAQRYFGELKDLLRPNEGVCVDFHNGAQEVEALFSSLGLDRGWYGNGIFTGHALPNIRTGCTEAVSIRDSTPDACIKKVLSWTVNTQAGLIERLADWELDALIVSPGVGENVTELLQEVPDVRLATYEDNPF